MQLKFINNTKAEGALLILLPQDLNYNVFEEPTLSLIIPRNNTNFTILTQVPFGMYRVFAYDIEESGLLTLPISTPAIATTTYVHGHSVSTKQDLIKKKEVNVTVEIILQQFIKLSCTYDSMIMSAVRGCMVSLSSRSDPESLRVQLQLRDSAYPLVYTVQPDTTYILTVFTIMEDTGIIHSSINSLQVHVGKFSYQTEFPKNIQVSSKQVVMFLRSIFIDF